MPQRKLIQLESDLREHITYDNHVIPLSICVDHFDDYYQREWDCHWHEEYEFGVVTQGKLRYTLYGGADGPQDVVLHPGEGIFINANVLHSAKALVANTVIDCFVLSKTIFKLKLFDAFGEQVLEPIAQSGLSGLFLPPHDPQNREIIASIQKLCALPEAGITYELQGLELTMHIWRHLIIAIQSRPEAAELGGSTKTDGRLKRIIRFVHENYRRDILIDELAQQAHISRAECFRIFKATLHKTPTQYVTDYRMSMATMLLTDTQRTLADIAVSCGFKTASYFGRKFRARFGMTPRQYQAKMAQENA
ncbi:helix-turn-helix domain-containing protein [Levilactobacillus angrenensis]|uniref:Helix-turn-helix domain-containing protein n=1 Tax=Levilactobacillus angrenensis TaxID=2486020 RepID=A0ABW1U718_9LACO|nr:AraC family transcriptional regulator [Levilactobacillus angrenensis]